MYNLQLEVPCQNVSPRLAGYSVDVVPLEVSFGHIQPQPLKQAAEFSLVAMRCWRIMKGNDLATLMPIHSMIAKLLN